MRRTRTPFRILAIDGGGIRGAVPAAFLAALEADLGSPLHEHFDYIAGSSAGGLLALYIGAKGGGAREAERMFSPEVSRRLMNKSIWDRLLPSSLLLRPRYDGLGKSEVLREVFGTSRLQFARRPTLVTAYDPAVRRFVAFKSHGGVDSAGNPYLHEVANATTAAPVFFPPASVSGAPPRLLIDGGLGANNPSMAAVAEALKMGVDVRDIVVVSLGTGHHEPDPADVREYQQKSHRWGGIDWLRHDLIGHVISASSSAVDYWCEQILGDRYIRVQSALEGASPAIDDVSAQNIAALKRIGVSQYDQYGAWVREAVRATPEPLTPINPAAHTADELVM